MLRRLRKRLFRWVAVSGIGAATAYFFDPDRGRARRAQVRDQGTAFLRRRQQDAERKARYQANVAEGQAVQAAGLGVPRPEDDVEVVHAVKQVLARIGIDTKDVTVESVEGRVTLRGQVDSRDSIARLEKAVSEAPGVTELQSFLHLPGTPAPNKATALQAS
jgi:osmotically-inducible protein OsmY